MKMTIRLLFYLLALIFLEEYSQFRFLTLRLNGSQEGMSRSSTTRNTSRGIEKRQERKDKE